MLFFTHILLKFSSLKKKKIQRHVYLHCLSEKLATSTSFDFMPHTHELQSDLSLTTMWRTDCVWASRMRKLLPRTMQEMMAAWTLLKGEMGGFEINFGGRTERLDVRQKEKEGSKRTLSLKGARMEAGDAIYWEGEPQRRNGWRGKESRHGMWKSHTGSRMRLKREASAGD